MVGLCVKDDCDNTGCSSFSFLVCIPARDTMSNRVEPISVFEALINIPAYTVRPWI